MSEDISSTEKERLINYANAVIHAPKHYHLTADESFPAFWDRHIADAIFLNYLIHENYETNLKIADIGSGNGVPGVPVALLRPASTISLIDSDTKKCSFLDAFCKSNCPNVQVLCERAEVLARSNLRESYDYVFARALAKLPVALELAAGFVKVNGHLIVPHGTSWKSEVEVAQQALVELGLEFESHKDYRLKDTLYTVLVFRKLKPLSERYPRRVGIPSKRPL